MKKPLCVLTVLAFCLCTLAAAQTTPDDTYLSSQIECGEQAQALLNVGDSAGAERLLARGVTRYPDSDWLRGLYGRALYLEGKLDMAEDQFQQALDINRDNPIAKALIKEVRQTKDLLKDKELDEWVGLGKDKLGDLVVIIVGVWLGTMMTMLSQRFALLFKRSHFDKALRREDWDVVTDILENLIANWKKRELRKNLELMLDRLPQERVREIIIKYVDDPQKENDLLHFLDKLHAKRD